jgi:Derlin-2/3
MGNASSRDDLMAAYQKMPKLAKNSVLTALFTSAVVQGGLVPYSKLAFDVGKIVRGLEVWRLGTSFLYFGPPSVSSALNLLMLYRSLASLEETGNPNMYQRLGCGCAAMLLVAAGVSRVLKFRFLSGALVSLSTTLWSLESPETKVSLYGVPLKAQYLPFAYAALNGLMSGGVPYDDVLGIVSGYFSHYALLYKSGGLTRGAPRSGGFGGGRLGGGDGGGALGASGGGQFRPGRQVQQRQRPEWRAGSGNRLGGGAQVVD